MIIPLNNQKFYERRGQRIDAALEQISAATKQLNVAVEALADSLQTREERHEAAEKFFIEHYGYGIYTGANRHRVHDKDRG